MEEKDRETRGVYESDEAVTTLGLLKTSPDQFYNQRNDDTQSAVWLSEPPITILAAKGINAHKAQSNLP
jgi:hypothetical protein